MAQVKAAVPFKGTKEQEEKLLQVIEAHKDQGGALMTILHEAQEIYGYLPEEVQSIIAEKLDMSMSEVFGVVTFYSRFSLTPKGNIQVAVCMGTACYVKGSGDILEKISKRCQCEVSCCSEDGEVSLDATRCIGACGLAPVLTVNGDVYGRVTVDDIDGILDKYLN